MTCRGTLETMLWLLAYTKPRQESLAEENLRRQGFEVFCPQLRVQKLRRRKWVWLEEPLFPRYLFVGAAAGVSWSPVRSTFGVVSLVRFGGRVAEVSPDLIDSLRVAAATRRLSMRSGDTSATLPPKRTRETTPNVLRTGDQDTPAAAPTKR